MRRGSVFSPVGAFPRSGCDGQGGGPPRVLLLQLLAPRQQQQQHCSASVGASVDDDSADDSVASAVDDSAPIFHVSPAGCRGGIAPIGYGWTNGERCRLT